MTRPDDLLLSDWPHGYGTVAVGQFISCSLLRITNLYEIAQGAVAEPFQAADAHWRIRFISVWTLGVRCLPRCQRNAIHAWPRCRASDRATRSRDRIPPARPATIPIPMPARTQAIVKA